MNGTPLVIDESVREQIKACVELAEANPLDMPTLMERIKDPQKKAHHMAQMTRQTVKVPLAYMVTFSIEHGHPMGTCRHMSMSVQREDRLPNEFGIWMIAQEFGFWGSLKDCAGWIEDLKGHGHAVNIVQPLTKP
jgi:hypothetical protein